MVETFLPCRRPAKGPHRPPKMQSNRCAPSEEESLNVVLLLLRVVHLGLEYIRLHRPLQFDWQVQEGLWLQIHLQLSSAIC